MEGANLIEGRKAFEDAVRSALAEAATAGWRELILCDPDFEHWPLGERAVVESLTQWIGGNRRLTLVAMHFDEVARRHSRWVRWRNQWAHLVSCRTVVEMSADDVPVLLLATGTLTLELDDRVRFLGRVSRDPTVALRARERVDVILQRSVEALPVTTLGL